MCGIAGHFGADDGAPERVRRLTSALARRGPDAEGNHAWGRAWFGHRRLSIFDLSEAGRQPMLTPDGRVGVVFNGAIYNFRSLRRELERAGFGFRTQTDTEVLLHGYRHWGIDALLERLRGMFAVGLWDDEAGKGYLFRDRLGVKPLVYAKGPDWLAFASTARALRAGGYVSRLDPEAVLEYLEYGYVTDNRVIFEGACKVPAGHVVEWADGRTLTREYWRLPEEDASSKVTFEEAVEETERLLIEAVRLRLDADVPVGALLSGGVDSSLICWAVARAGADIRAFTVGTRGEPGDETADAVQTARQLGIGHEVIDLTGQQEPEIGDLVKAYAEPFACSSALGMLRVCRAVKPSATVLLTGDGGDDVFLGYPEHGHLYAAQRLARSLPQPLLAASRAVMPLKRGRNFLGYAAEGLTAVIRAHDGLPVYEQEGVLGERLRHRHLAARQRTPQPGAGQRVLDEFLVHDRAGRFVGEYMTKVDGGAMHWAVEARGPLLDAELWSFASRLPYRLRLAHGRSKALLRELARRHLGERVAYGAKRGFTIPATRWLTGAWRPRWEDGLKDSRLIAGGWMNESLPDWWRRCLAAGGEAPLAMWRLFVLEYWLRAEEEKQS